MVRTVKTITEQDKEKMDPPDGNDLVDEGNEGAAVVDQGPTPEEVAADLRKQLEAANTTAAEERRKREEAEALAGKQSSAAASAVQSQIATYETAAANKIAAAKTNLDSIKQQLKQAKSAGDGDAEVELQDALNNARYELNSAETDERNFKNWKAQQERAAREAPQRTEASGSPYTAAEQAWIASHPQFNSSKKFARLAKVAAQEAKDDGHAQDSKGYFTYIENALREEGLLAGDEKDPTSGAAETNISTSTATPPTRSGNGTAATVRGPDPKYPFVPKNFNIPKEWVQAASDQGFDDPREYANMRLEDEAAQKTRQ